MENWISVEPISGVAGADPTTVNVIVEAAPQVLGGKEPRQTQLIISNDNIQKQVNIVQKGSLYINIRFKVSRQSNSKFTASTSIDNLPESQQEPIYWCIDKFCWRFEGYTGDASEIKDYIAPAGTVTLFLPEDDRDGKTKIIYHGDSSNSQVFGDTTQDIPLINKYNNYVEFDFTELNENRTKKFKPVTIQIIDVEENKDFYYSFGIDYGDGNGVQWTPKTRIHFGV